MTNHVGIVFDHDECVAQPLELAEDGTHPVLSARMEPERGFIESEERSRESGRELRGEPDPLGFAARKRGALPIEG